MDMADRIKERRLAMGYTQEELAQKLGLQKSAIAKYENGRVENIKRTVILNMANILETSPAYLMGWESEDELQLFKEKRRAGMDAWNIQYYEKELLSSFSELNDDNKKKTIDYSKKLLDLQKFEESTILDAAHDRTDIEVTEEMKKDDDAFFDED